MFEAARAHDTETCREEATRKLDNIPSLLPVSLPDGLPDVPEFDMRLLPEALRGWVQDIADRLQCPPDYPSVGSVSSLSAVVGRQIHIRPKRKDDWMVVPNLWGAIVGPPGIQKTPAITETLKPLRALEAQARDAHEIALQGFEVEKMVAEATAKATREKVAKAVKNGDDAKAAAMEGLDDEPEEPQRRRYMTSDPTVEKLGELLAANPRGILVFRD